LPRRADNVGFGEHDWDILANDWDSEELEDWGVDIINEQKDIKKETQEINRYEKAHILISFNPSDFLKIKDIIDKLYEIDNIEIEQSAN